MDSRRNLILGFVCLMLLCVQPLGAQENEGLWFDIGIDQTTVVSSPDSLAQELFPPFPFGPYYPPGTLVYASVSRIACDQLPLIDCEGGRLITAYTTFFNDGGCGCGGYLFEAARIHISYDGRLVEELGADESELTIVHYDWEFGWVPLDNLIVDTEADFIEGDTVGWILGDHYYAVSVGFPTPVTPTTWGSLKTQW